MNNNKDCPAGQLNTHGGVLNDPLKTCYFLVSHGGSQITLLRKNVLEVSLDGKLESEEKTLQGWVKGGKEEHS